MADSESSAEDRELPASEQRLAKAAEDGNVPRSRDLAHLVVPGVVIMTIYALAEPWGRALKALIRTVTTFDGGVRSNWTGRLATLAAAAVEAVVPLAAVLAVCIAGAVLSATVPGGLNFATKALRVDPGRINPMSGFGRLASVKHLVEVLKSVALSVVLGIVAWWFIGSSLPDLQRLTQGALPAAAAVAMQFLVGGLAVLLLVVGAVAVLDVPWQWWKHRADLKMTREEAKQEYKESEGDPHVKGQRKQRQREMARHRMLGQVPTADVVLTNPTHFAVALRYDARSAGAPVVVAKGIDALAQRIQAIARESDVPVLSSPALARSLYTHVPLDREVPRELYAVIAQVLTWVFQLRQWVPGRSTAPREPAGLQVPDELFVPEKD